MHNLSHEHILTDPHLAPIFRSVRLNDMPKCTKEHAIGVISKDERISELCVEFVKMINDVFKYILKSFCQTAETISIIEIDWDIDVLRSLTR
jgi:hypothetical protein